MMSARPKGKSIIVDRPYRLAPIALPAPYKVLYGGRLGVKSWTIARQMLVDAISKPIKVLCCRETMKSIAESVHSLLSEQIKLLGMSGNFQIQQNCIKGINGSLFTYAGLRQLKDAANIKSYEGFDRAWVEEAQLVSKTSWEILIPTIRKDGSEIWVSFNPDLETDETYKRFVLHPPPGTVLIKTSHRDNLWLSQKSKDDMAHLKETDPDEYEWVYEGACRSTLEGAVFAEELRLMDRESRVAMIPYDRERPVDTYWDLGIGDATAIWFVQGFPFQWRFIDYLEGEGQKLGYYLQQLQAKGYLYGTHHLPHDGAARELGTGKSIEELMRLQGMNVVIVPRLSIADTINASRTVFNQCWFDGEHCADGLQALRHYVWPKNSQGIAAREPEHNWASHGSSAFRYFAVGRNIGQVKKAAPPPRLAPPRQYGNNSWMG